MSLLRKQMEPAHGAEPCLAHPRPADLDECEALWEFLYMTRWEEDGTPRVTGTVLVFVDSGLCKVMLNDRDGQRVAFISVRGPDGILDAANAALVATDTAWKAVSPAKRTK